MLKGNTAHRQTEACQDIYVKYNEKYADRWGTKSSGVLCACYLYFVSVCMHIIRLHYIQDNYPFWNHNSL